MRGALTVRVVDDKTDRHVTLYARDLRFRKTAPGGHHSASMRLILPRFTFRDLGPADRVYIYDASTGRTIWEGYAENPTPNAGPNGEEFELAAMGGMALASDQAERLIYLDRSFEPWRRDDTLDQAASASTESSAFPDTGNPCLKCQFNPGQPITTGSQARMLYDAFVDSQMELGGFVTSSKGGKADANYVMEWVVPGTILAARNLATSGTDTARFAGTDWATSLQTLAVRLRRQAGGATNVADDNTWAGFGSLRILGRRVDKFGALMTHTQADYVLASDVVTDLLGRLLGECDPAASTIETTTAQIDQLAYHDATRAERVFDDLALHEPDFLWEILHSTPAGHVFKYRAWPTTPRYEISVKDGYHAPGGEADLCNRIAVTWTDPKGQKRAEIVTTTVEALGSRTKDAEPITLPDGQGSQANAQRIGTQVLASKNSPPKAATARVRRPILDHLRGMTVMPWEIEPGYLVRVRETGDDLRLTEMEYDDADCTATLTLGEPQRTQEQLLAALSRRVA